MDRYQETKKATIVGMFVNASLAFIKMLIGAVGRSPALFADGVHSLSDLISDVMVLFAAKYANKGEDENHPYGHERIETLATLVLSALLIAVGFTIVYHSLATLYFGEYQAPSLLTVVAAIISIFGNEFIYQYTTKIANKINSDILRVNAWHSRSDMWSSVVVLVGLVGALLGFVWMDALAAIVVCYMIVKMGVKWGYSAVAELIDEGVDEDTQSRIQQIISKVEGVQDFHCLRSRKMAGKIILDVHVLVDKYMTASEGHYIAEKVRTSVFYGIDNIKDITVHIDVVNHEDEFINPKDLEPSRINILAELKTFMALHSLNVDILSDKEMLMYYLEDRIELMLFIKDKNCLDEFQTKLSIFKIARFDMKVLVLAHK